MKGRSRVLAVVLQDVRTGYEETVALIPHGDTIDNDGATGKGYWYEVVDALQDCADLIPRPDGPRKPSASDTKDGEA